MLTGTGKTPNYLNLKFRVNFFGSISISFHPFETVGCFFVRMITKGN
jgi:hypothetical protein